MFWWIKMFEWRMYNNRWSSDKYNENNILFCRYFLTENLVKPTEERLSNQFRKRKYFRKNIFPNFHFGHAVYIAHIQRYHSSPKQLFIKFEKSYRAACLNNWVFIVRSINSIKFKVYIQLPYTGALTQIAIFLKLHILFYRSKMSGLVLNKSISLMLFQ